MRKYLILLCVFILVCGTIAYARMSLTVIAGENAAAPGGPVYILEELFTAANGTDLNGYNSWSGTTTNYLEIQSNAAQVTPINEGADQVAKTFTEQNNATFTYEFTVTGGTANEACCSSNYEPIIAYDATNGVSFGLPSVKLAEESDDQWSVSYTQAGTGDLVVAAADQTIPFKVEVECNLTADTFNMWVGGSKVITDVALKNTGQAADTLAISQGNSWPGSQAVFTIDDVKVYLGARQ